jgi:hypothetical protein
MTLASILLISLLSASPTLGHTAPAPVPSQSQPTPDQTNPAAKQTQNSASPSNTTAGPSGAAKPGTASQSSSSQGKTGKKLRHKKNLSVNCNNVIAQNAAKSTSSASTADPAAKKNEPTTSTRCPPTKVIVRQGSTTEPSIQVVGGAEGSQASDERNNAIQMLETTEANLKKIEGTQLDSNQQDMIKQVHQFMDQSKAASSSGDLDQARTLAWKAQMLSEELLKVQK